ncbi:tetratricopeptide repeat protein [Glutamicibacter sp.]|uniref:tetratricopeptide repeat protein n=1 Tax=Glutamicibacter sp. TaxID=1931995 RepID=UPI0028BDC25D|nr:tetratricopeptide repeat protein [Glutamicibacter sp.]
MSNYTGYAIDVASVNREGVGTSIPGVLIDPTTLKPYIADDAAASYQMQVGSPTDQVAILLARGELAQAGELIAESRFTDPTNAYLRVLDTELTRMQGNFDRAINRLRKLAEEFAGTEFEPLMHHHLGFSFFAKGDFKAAATRFRKAMDQRIEMNDDGYLINASSVCLQIAEERAHA